MSSSEFAALLNGFWMGGSISGHAIDNNDGMDLKRVRDGVEEE